MFLRAALVAAAVLAASAAQALPPDQFTIPNNDPAQQKKDSSDGLFNHSVPDRWNNDSSDRASGSGSNLGKFHFSVRSSEDNYLVPRSSYGDAKTPDSEFWQPLPSTPNADPLFDNNH
jgi:hypothetical protein